MPKLPVKIFSSHPGAPIEQTKLYSVQIDSYKWFEEKGIAELFEEISPIKSHVGDLELYFLDYYFSEPKYSEKEVYIKGITYEAPLRARLKLANKKTGKSKEQEVYLGDFPIMTERGTFVINGVERVVISQIIRSPGIYFTLNIYRGRKLFGGKIIPNRGIWLEFETDPDGFIGVKIDRHRKVAITDLLRIFGMSDDEMRKTFGDQIKATLNKDDAKDVPNSYLEVYKRIRPGDLATAEDAKRLIDAMFWDPARYDLSAVGRFKLNQRLQMEGSSSRLLGLNDIVKVVKEIVSLNNNPKAEPDDIDHLSNRRVRAVGELLQGRLRVGFARLRRNVQDKMSTLEAELINPVSLVNPRLLTSVVQEFFSSSSVSQFMDQDNPLSEVEHKRRLTALGPGGLTKERASIEVRDVHESYYAKICPIQSPEGQNIGLVSYFTNFAKINEYGFIVAPYIKVEHGKLTGKIMWLDAAEEEKYKIAASGTKFDKQGRIIDKQVDARVKAKPGICNAEDIDFITISPNQLISVATSLVPFLEHDDANRALMASNMQRQAVPSVRPDAPYVGTGMEDIVARDSGYMVFSDIDGVITEVDGNHITVKPATAGKPKVYELTKFKMSNKYMSINQKPLVRKGDKIKKGDALADGHAMDDSTLSLGQNLVVAFTSFGGLNFEDAIILSERVQQDDRFTSIHIEDFFVNVRDTKLGPEITTPDIPNVSEDKLKNLDESGIIRIGAEVRSGDILVGKISPKGESELTPEERLVRAIFGEKARDVKDASLELPHGKSGRVVGIKVFSRGEGDKLEPGVIQKIQVQVAELRNVRAGDKLAGRHGNKGVVSRVLPVEDMPYLEDGRPVDIVLNPLGIASRMNLGQLFETHLGWAAKKLGYRAYTPVFSGATEEQIREELKKAGLPENGKVTLYDGRTGRPLDNPVTVGVIYIMKLNHLVVDKIHMRSVGPYSLITQQPLGGKAQLGGQRFGEMEVWALEGYGASHTLQEMLTIKSDDVMGRSSAFESIIRGEKIKKPNIPAAFNVMLNELKALGLSVKTTDEEENYKKK